MKTKTCLHLFPGPAGAGHGIKIEQTGIDRFTISYGLQVKKGLDYTRAAAEFGRCVFHHLACQSLLDNSERGEK